MARSIPTTGLHSLSTPLSEISNHQANPYSLSNGQQHPISKPRQPHRLSRQKSSRNFANRHDSSDTLPSSTDSIFNAEKTDSSDLNTLSDASMHRDATTPPLLPLFMVAPRAIFKTNSDLDLSLSHSRWPVRQLEPIIEQRSRSQIRKSSSLPRLQPSPERRVPEAVKAQRSAHSVHPATSSPGRDSIRIHNTIHERSFSLSDLDCLPRSDTKAALSLHQDRFSHSSEEILGTCHACLPFPLRPTYTPPYRCPTPPGLPSFGTKEALTYRLTASPSSNRAVTLLRRFWRRDHHQREHQSSINRTPFNLSLIPRTNENINVAQMALLRRIMGAPHLVRPIPQRSATPRSRLPVGVSVAPGPGALAKADDGTLVRGCWARRQSGHGVGQRGIDSHPFTHVARLHSVDETVQEIDKACAAADELSRSQQILRMAGSTPVLPETTNRDALQHTAYYYQELHNAISDMNQDNERGASELIGRNASSSGTPTSSRMRLDGPSAYAILFSRDSNRQNSLGGFRDYIEQGEREQAQRHIRDQEEDESYCKRCREGFWWFCCTPTGRKN